MARTSTYLNFAGNTEQAFEFYRKAFGTEYIGGIHRMGDVPSSPGMPALSDAEKRYVMHVELPVTGGHVLMGTDTLESFGQKLVFGNNFSISLEPDTKAEADRLMAALSEGGKVGMPMQDMFWGAYWGHLTDAFGVPWMINVPTRQGAAAI